MWVCNCYQIVDKYFYLSNELKYVNKYVTSFQCNSYVHWCNLKNVYNLLHNLYVRCTMRWLKICTLLQLQVISYNYT